jgi:hypothetical protein
MIQVSLERLFAGIAESLRDAIAPELTDPYARAQAEDAANLLDNVATRIQWRSDLLLADLDRVIPLLQRGVAAAGPEQLPHARALLAELPDAPSKQSRPDAESLVAERNAALLALGELQDWLGQAGTGDPSVSTEGVRSLRADVQAFLLWQLDDEASRLRRPPRAGLTAG